ncbi:hypothetical protein EDB89DRAFT_1901215 [Lactarius sanguifluus]|nr:hypothetical protein EDB89DRAFT_1901215 [Lactarius sanguifluus]
MASQRLTTTDHDVRTSAKRTTQKDTTNDNDALAKRLAREYATKGEGMTCTDEICLIIALMQRQATRLTHEQVRVQANTSLRQSNGQRSAATPTTPRANSVKVNTNPSKNRYALLDPDGTGNEIHQTATAHGWTVVTHKRKRTTGRDAKPTPSSPDAPTNNPHLRPKAVTEVEAHAGIPARGDAEVEAHVETPMRGDAEVEAHVNESTCGDVQTQAEAHAEIPARGDAHPSPIPSPDHGVTPLTGRLNAQSDISRVARTRSPKMVQLLRRIREASNVGQTPHAPSNPDVPSDEQQARPETAEAEAPIGEPMGGDAHPSSMTRETDVAPREGNRKALDGNNTDCEELNENAPSSRMLSPRLLEMRRQVRAVAAETSQAKGDEEMTPSHHAMTNDAENCNLPDNEQMSRRGDARCTIDPIYSAERYCQTLGPLTDKERHDAISRYLMEGRWNDDEEDEEDIPVELAQDDASHNPRESSNRKDEATTPSENDLVIAINTLTNEECEELRETLLADDTPLTKQTWGRYSNRLKVAELTITPSIRADRVLTAGDTLDDEELWGALTRDDCKEALGLLLMDDDADDSPPRGGDICRLMYGTYKPEEEDDEPFHAEEHYDDRDNYSVPSSGEYDDEAMDFDERDTLFNLSNGLTDWMYGTEGSDDECEIPLRHNEGDSREEITTELHGRGRAQDLTMAPATVPPVPVHDLVTIVSSDRPDLTSSNSEVVREQCLSPHPIADTEARLSSSDDSATPNGRRGKCPDKGTSILVEKKPGVDGLARRDAIPSPLSCPHQSSRASLILASNLVQSAQYSDQRWAKRTDLPARKIGRCKRALGETLGWRPWVGTVSSPRFLPRSRSTSVQASNNHGSTSHHIASTDTTGQAPTFGHDRRWNILGNLDGHADEDGPSRDPETSNVRDTRRKSYANYFTTGRRVLSHGPDDGRGNTGEGRSIHEIALPLQRFAQWASFRWAYNPIIDTGTSRTPALGSDKRAIDPEDIDQLRTNNATNPIKCKCNDAQASRPMCRRTYHSRPLTREIPAPHPVALPDTLSCTGGGRCGTTKSSNVCEPRSATGITRVLPRVVIMEADSLRGGVISPFPASSTSIPRDNPTEPRKYQVRSRENDFRSVNVAIQAVLTLCTQSQPTRAAVDESNDKRYIIPITIDAKNVTNRHATQWADRYTTSGPDVHYDTRRVRAYTSRRTETPTTPQRLTYMSELHLLQKSGTSQLRLSAATSPLSRQAPEQTPSAPPRHMHHQPYRTPHTLPTRPQTTASKQPLAQRLEPAREDGEIEDDEDCIDWSRYADMPSNNCRYVFPRNTLEQLRSPDELATDPPILSHHNTNTRSIARGDARQSCHTNATQTNHPQRYRPYDPAAVRASTRTSRAGEQPCRCSDPEHEKRHCHRNKCCTLCNSPGHAPNECLFPHRNCRDKQRCRVGAKHAHVNDNDGCPWTKTVVSRATPRGTTLPNTSESTKSLHTLGLTQSTQPTARSPIVRTLTRTMERSALRPISTTARATPPVTPRPKLPQSLLADFGPLKPRRMTGRRSHLQFPRPLGVPMHDTPTTQTQDNHRSCPTAIPNASSVQTLTIDHELTQSPTLDTPHTTTTVTADSMPIPTPSSHSTTATVAATETEGTTALNDYTTYHHRHAGNSIVLSNSPYNDAYRSPTGPWTSIVTGPRDPLTTARGQLGREAKDAPSSASIPREKSWHSAALDHTPDKNITSDSVSTNVRTAPPSTAHPTSSNRRPPVSPSPSTRHTYLTRPTTPSPKQPANPTPRRALPPPHNDRP